MVVMINYLDRLPISYITKLMGFLPIVSLLVELLHRLVPSQVLSNASGSYLGVDVGGVSNMWLYDVHPCCNSFNGVYSSILS